MLRGPTAAAGVVAAEGGAGIKGGAGGGGEAEPRLSRLLCCGVVVRICRHRRKSAWCFALYLCGNAINQQQSILRDFIAHCEKAHDAAHLQMFVVLLLIQE